MGDENHKSSEPTLGHDDWHDLLAAAEAAGRLAARELARRCSPWQLGRTGGVWVDVAPIDSPVARWLHHTGAGRPHQGRTGILVAITVTPNALHPVTEAATKVRSLLIRRAYAAAYATVLTEEAGVIAEVVTEADLPIPPARSASPPDPTSPPARTRGPEDTASPDSRRSQPCPSRTESAPETTE